MEAFVARSAGTDIVRKQGLSFRRVLHLVPGSRARDFTRAFRRRDRVLSAPGDEDVASLRPPVGLAILMVGN